MTDADMEDEICQWLLSCWDKLDLNKHCGCILATVISEQVVADFVAFWLVWEEKIHSDIVPSALLTFRYEENLC